MSNCKYNPLGAVPKDGNFPIALSSRNISACSTRSNTVEANDLIVNDNLTVNGDLTATNVIATNDVTAGNDMTATGDLTATNVIATNDVTAGNDVTATGDVTGTNLIATNNVSAGNDVTATGNVEATTVLVQPDGSYPQYDLPTVSGAILNILAYGGDRTGVADTSAIVTAVLGAGGRNIYFPAGTYRFNTPITLPQNVKLYGDHYGNVFVNYYDNTPGTRMFTLNLNDNVVEDMYIRYQGTATDAVLFYGNNLARAQINRIQTDFALGFETFGLFEGTSRIIVDNSTITSTGTHITIADTSVLILTNNIFGAGGTDPCVEATDTAIVMATDNIIGKAATTAFLLAAAGSYFTNTEVQAAVGAIYGGAGAAGATILSKDGTELSNLTNGLNLGGSLALTSGTGDPNGVVVAPLGALYINLAGGAGTSLYVKEADAGLNTGWVGK